MKPGQAVMLVSAMVVVATATLAQQNGIQIENAWSRPAMQGRVGVVYLTIVDHGAADRLTGVSSPIAERAELHESFSEGGMAKMRPVASLTLDQSKPAVLAPGGYHIMLMGLKQPLKQGEAFPITLTFANAGEVTSQVTVQGPGGGAPMNMPMHGSPGVKP